MSTPRRDETLLVSCYELGRQPLALAGALACLERAGHRAHALDLSVEPMADLDVAAGNERLRVVGISVPMHTALRTGIRAAERIRQQAPTVHICLFGLYATLNAKHLLETVADSVIGGEFEEPLTRLVGALTEEPEAGDVEGVILRDGAAEPYLHKLSFPVPDREKLPPLASYAKLEADGRVRQAAAIEASRGCLHLCRHCPIPPVYGGRFFVVPREVVLADVRNLVRGGVSHLTFADPDFFNGPGHSMALVRAIHAEFPELTFDMTTKVDRVLMHRDKLAELAKMGLIFVVSAVESLSDQVLTNLDKGHTRAEVFAALAALAEVGVAMRPSLVAFTPWTRMEDYLETIEWIARDGLVEHVDPVQLSIRLLIPPGSLLAGAEAMQPFLGALAPLDFSFVWTHPDPRMDLLQREVATIVGEATLREATAHETFERIRLTALEAAGETARAASPFSPLPLSRSLKHPPRLTEPWFC